MNKYCLWKWNGDDAVILLLFKYKFKKTFENNIDIWHSYCCVDDIVKIFSEKEISENKQLLKKIGNYWYVYTGANYYSFWDNVFTKVIEFEAENDEEALLRAELER